MPRSLTSQLYRAARISATVRAVRRHRATQRIKNIVVGRTLARAGFWRALWGGGRRRR